MSVTNDVPAAAAPQITGQLDDPRVQAILTYQRQVAAGDFDQARQIFCIAALTAREQQLALMAAAGRTDLTISVELNISIRTVQAHLLRAYAKLGISGRHQLPEVL